MFSAINYINIIFILIYIHFYVLYYVLLCILYIIYINIHKFEPCKSYRYESVCIIELQVYCFFSLSIEIYKSTPKSIC